MRKEQLAHSRTSRWVLAKKPEGHQAQTRIQPLPRNKLWVGLHNRLVQLRGSLVFTPPRELTGDDFINHNTDRPHIRRKTIGVPQDDLGSCCLWGAEAVGLLLDIKVWESVVRVFFTGASSATVG